MDLPGLKQDPDLEITCAARIFDRESEMGGSNKQRRGKSPAKKAEMLPDKDKDPDSPEDLPDQVTNAQIMAKLDCMTSDLSSVKELVNDLKSSVEDSQADIRETYKRLEQTEIKIKELETDMADLKGKYNTLSTNHNQLQEQVLRLEAQSRRDNLLLDGIAETENEDYEKCRNLVVKILEENLGIVNASDVRFVRCHRLGPRRANSTRPRTMIFKLHWFQDRERIWSQRSKLKGSSYFLSEDFPAVINQRRRILQPVLRAARDQKLVANLSVDKLTIEGRTYTVDSISHLPPNLHPAYIATHTRQNMTAFFSSASPLSNFHTSKFQESDINFHSSEQCYQHKKALAFNDRDSAAKILAATTPLQCYRLGLKIKDFDKDKWHTQAQDAMYSATKAKFSANPKTRDFLIQTNATKLVEANPKDHIWGVGLSLRDKDIWDESKWKGRNWLGEVLMKVRDEVKNQI